jgi:hypothetical protein
MTDVWSEDIEIVLENIRQNCVLLSKNHKQRYYLFKSYLKYFRIPLICLSALNSIFAVGLQPYMIQSTISIINCFISLICGIITSVELYLGVQKQMENEFISSKSYYLLGIDIFKTLSLNREHRTIGGLVYLEEKYNEYCKLIESTNLTTKRIKDKLAPVEEKMLELTQQPSSPEKPNNGSQDSSEISSIEIV